MTDFPDLSKKIFRCDPNIRGLTFGRFDGEILHFEMRPGVASLNPPGEIGKMDVEVLMPTLRSYFEKHSQYFGKMEYIQIRFEKVSLTYLRHDNIFLIMSVQPGVATYPIVKKVNRILRNHI